MKYLSFMLQSLLLIACLSNSALSQEIELLYVKTGLEMAM